MRFKDVLNEIYKKLNKYTRDDIISLLPKTFLSSLLKQINLNDIVFETVTNDIVNLLFDKEIDFKKIDFNDIKKYKIVKEGNKYRLILFYIKTNILDIEKKDDKEDIIKLLKSKKLYGTIDRLKRGIISIDDAKNELYGNKKLMSDEEIKEIDRRKSYGGFKDIYELASHIKYKLGIDKQSSYSQYVRYTNLKPEIDAKQWFRVYDEV